MGIFLIGVDIRPLCLKPRHVDPAFVVVVVAVLELELPHRCRDRSTVLQTEDDVEGPVENGPRDEERLVAGRQVLRRDALDALEDAQDFLVPGSIVPRMKVGSDDLDDSGFFWLGSSLGCAAVVFAGIGDALDLSITDLHETVPLQQLKELLLRVDASVLERAVPVKPARVTSHPDPS